MYTSKIHQVILLFTTYYTSTLCSVIPADYSNLEIPAASVHQNEAASVQPRAIDVLEIIEVEPAQRDATARVKRQHDDDGSGKLGILGGAFNKKLGLIGSLSSISSSSKSKPPSHPVSSGIAFSSGKTIPDIAQKKLGLIGSLSSSSSPKKPTLILVRPVGNGKGSFIGGIVNKQLGLLGSLSSVSKGFNEKKLGLIGSLSSVSSTSKGGQIDGKKKLTALKVGGAATALGGLTVGTLGLLGSLSKISKAKQTSPVFPEGSSSHDNRPPQSHSPPLDWKELKTSIFASLLQAVKAISGGVIALNGQLIKVNGHLLSSKGAFIYNKGEQISNFGKNLATNAFAYPHPIPPAHDDASVEDDIPSAPAASGPGNNEYTSSFAYHGKPIEYYGAHQGGYAKREAAHHTQTQISNAPRDFNAGIYLMRPKEEDSSKKGPNAALPQLIEPQLIYDKNDIQRSDTEANNDVIFVTGSSDQLRNLRTLVATEQRPRIASEFQQYYE